MAIQLMLKGSKADKKNKSVELPIFLRYSHNGMECLISTKKKISPAHWDESKEKPRNSYPGGPVNLSRYLTKFKGEVEKAVTDIQNDGEDPAPDLVKERYTQNVGGVQRIKSTVLSAWRSRLLERARKKSNSTNKNEKDSFASFENYLESIGKTGISLPKLNKDIISGYEDFLSRERTRDNGKKDDDGKKKLAPYTLNTKGKKLKHLKAFLKSVDHPITKYIEFKEKPGNKIWLTQNELALFQTHDFSNNPRLDRVRDLFVLQCHTGLRVSDLKRLNKAHLNEGLTIRAQKNKELIKMPITPSIKTILEKYNYVLPEISDQKYNDYIKEVAEKIIPDSEVEITEYRGGQTIHTTRKKHEEISSHDAVRTFITLKAQLGMPISSIAVLTGKTVAVILKNYLGKDEGQAQKDALKYDFSLMAVS